MTAKPADLEARIQAIEDRQAIEDIIVRYALAVDGGDLDLVASCFTDDAQASFAGVPAGPGGPAIASFLQSLMGTGERPVTLHRFTNVTVDLDGDEAAVRSSALAYALRPGTDQLRLRNVSYRDRFVRTDKGWRIADRVHSVAWEAAADSVPLTPIARPGA
jgi:ketosteroid isomerase-like protein